jgi:hypothetical protein
VADDIQAIIETFGLLNSENYEKALELVDPEFEMYTPPDIASEPDTYRGPDGVRRWWESFLESMEWVRLGVENVYPVDDHRVIIQFVMHTRGRTSGIETDQRAVGLAEAREGLLLRLQFFTTVAQAQEAAELPSS